ncbi:MAG: hypothetical protein IJ349_10815 [Clostridia bacterium]|nr:hypothetical protein [Clostridia bacterium]
MNWDIAKEVWESFIDFMEALIQWLMYVFGEGDTWPPEDAPNLDFGI